MKDRFLALIPRNILSDEGKALLDRPISLEELHVALSAMQKEAVPGEDGLTVNFYLTFWNFIKDPLFASFRYAFECGQLSITQRWGLIKLIPKKDKNSLLVASWRPITLLNVDYKMLTKLFAGHLSVLLPDLIHSDQKGFIKHRTIHDNLLDIQAIMHTCEQDDSETMLILLDIQKAFDSISWDFLFSVLTQYGFPQSFLHWFSIFYTEKQLHILNQGQFSEVVFPERGVAQGCKISPLFFILGIEVLALAICEDSRTQSVDLNGLSKKINLLADDSILALQWAKSTLDVVKEVLHDFYQVSSLKVNPNKSLIVPLGSANYCTSRLEEEQTFPVALDGCFTYLGVHWSKSADNFVIDKVMELELQTVKNIAANRSGHTHSLLGRILNIKSLMVPRFCINLSVFPHHQVSGLNMFKVF